MLAAKVLSSMRGELVLVRLLPGLGFTACLSAQDTAPLGIVRGSLVECDSTHLTLRTAESQLFHFVIDSKTFIERNHYRTSCSRLNAGEPLEVVSDRSVEPRMRYARLISVVDPEVRAPR